MENSVATRPRYPVILKHLYMHFYMHNPGAYTPPPSCFRASEREREKLGYTKFFDGVDDTVKGSVSNRCATIHSNDCSFAARPQRLSTFPRRSRPRRHSSSAVSSAHTFPPIPRPLLRAFVFPLHRRKPTVHSFPFSNPPPPPLLFGRATAFIHISSNVPRLSAKREILREEEPLL